jgi:Spy/CpxP family protein refolding chaperone
VQYKKSLISIILTILLTVSFLAFSQPVQDIKIVKHRGSNDKRIEMTDEVKDFESPVFVKLKLTDEQEKEFNKLRLNLQKKQIESRAKVQTAEIELKELFDVDNPDRDAIGKKMNELSELKNNLRMNRIDHWFAVNKILKPEQQIIWKKHFSKGHMAGKMGFDGPRGPSVQMRVQKNIRECNPDCPNLNPDKN